MSVKWTIKNNEIYWSIGLIIMEMGHRLMIYSLWNPKNFDLILDYVNVHKEKYLLRFCKWDRKLGGLDFGESSTLKCT